MGDRQATAIPDPSSAVITVDGNIPTPSVTEEVIHLGDRTQTRQHVQWTADTVDNENMGKKSSKCCCIYKKKKKWNEDSDSDDSDCETGHCRGHVEKKHQHHDDNNPGSSGTCT
ncbi:hypothetical protein FO519_003425 [Halicephalobus sp. NKZ332]|nr:hypothetical protein FO519_003425 [Halicephalobus sp. NKZ332]